ncbi:MAG: TetR/AcrR family transcriptional regulator [Caulobacter sp.]|nr:TetR/AcrR family transcriptional regulator [Caulobacter sp.]
MAGLNAPVAPHPAVSAVPRRTSPGPQKFASHIEMLARQSEKRRDPEKTRRRLLAAAARFSETGSFAAMTVKDVTGAAQVSHGAFYLYFSSIEHLVADVLSQFVDWELRTMPSIDIHAHPFEVRLTMVRWYQLGFKANVGLMRNMVLLSDTVPEVAGIWRRRGREIVDRFLDYYRLKYRLAPAELSLLRIAHHAVGSMSDHSLFARYGVHGAAETSEERDEELLIELHAALSYRALFGVDPPVHLLKRADGLVKLASLLA